MPWVRWADQGLPQWVLDATNVGIAAADCAPPLPEIDPQEWAAAVTYWRTVLAAKAAPASESYIPGTPSDRAARAIKAGEDLINSQFGGPLEPIEPGVDSNEVTGDPRGKPAELIRCHPLIFADGEDLVHQVTVNVQDGGLVAVRAVDGALVVVVRHHKLLALHGLVTRYVGRGYLAVRDQLQRKAGTRQPGDVTRLAVGEYRVVEEVRRAYRRPRRDRGMR